MTAPTINHGDLARSRIATQYTESTRFIAYIRALMTQSDEIESLLYRLAEISDIDSAEGVNLDVIGSIVGISRKIPNALLLQFFGFDGFPGADRFGEEGVMGIGSRFREERESTTATSFLADPEYRLLIRAKIVKNHSRGTIEDILNGLSYLFGINQNVRAVVVDNADMSISVALGRQLTFVEQAVVKGLDILPRPAGVRIQQYAYFNGDGYLGFEGQPGAVPFAEEGYTGPIGQLMEEF